MSFNDVNFSIGVCSGYKLSSTTRQTSHYECGQDLVVFSITRSVKLGNITQQINDYLTKYIIEDHYFTCGNEEEVMGILNRAFLKTQYTFWSKNPLTSEDPINYGKSTYDMSICVGFIKDKNIYVARTHDSNIVLGMKESNSRKWLAKSLSETLTMKQYTPTELLKTDFTNINHKKFVPQELICSIIPCNEKYKCLIFSTSKLDETPDQLVSYVQKVKFFNKLTNIDRVKENPSHYIVKNVLPKQEKDFIVMTIIFDMSYIKANLAKQQKKCTCNVDRAQLELESNESSHLESQD